MAQIKIDFPSDFERNEVLPIPLGRLIIGDSVCRLFFTKKGKLGMVIPREAVSNGDVIISEPLPEGTLFGFTE